MEMMRHECTKFIFPSINQNVGFTVSIIHKTLNQPSGAISQSSCCSILSYKHLIQQQSNAITNAILLYEDINKKLSVEGVTYECPYFSNEPDILPGEWFLCFFVKTHQDHLSSEHLKHMLAIKKVYCLHCHYHIFTNLNINGFIIMEGFKTMHGSTNAWALN